MRKPEWNPGLRRAPELSAAFLRPGLCSSLASASSSTEISQWSPCLQVPPVRRWLTIRPGELPGRGTPRACARRCDYVRSLGWRSVCAPPCAHEGGPDLSSRLPWNCPQLRRRVADLQRSVARRMIAGHSFDENSLHSTLEASIDSAQRICRAGRGSQPTDPTGPVSAPRSRAQWLLDIRGPALIHVCGRTNCGRRRGSVALLEKGIYRQVPNRTSIKG